MNNVIFYDEDFKKSSFSRTGMKPGGGCVSVAQKDGVIAVRDTKDASKTTLYFNREEWTAFLKGMEAGEFNLVD